MFSTRKGTPLAADNLRKRELWPACDEAKLRRIDWHTLRHTHGTLLHSLGASLKSAQAQLGHSRLTSTLDVYTHAIADEQRAAVQKLNEQLKLEDLFPNVPSLEQSVLVLKGDNPVIQ